MYYTTLDQYACNDGIIVGAKVGEEVVSPGNGRIVNIEDTDRYGKVVTILLGNYYKAYCGQLENVDYEIGDDIQEGDVIGTVAEPTRSFVLEGPNVFLFLYATTICKINSDVPLGTQILHRIHRFSFICHLKKYICFRGTKCIF